MQRTAARSDAPPVRLPVRIWLWAVAAMITAMVVVGGATRLTGSGLSITEWQVVVGTLPPLSDAAWEAAFSLYRDSPQYALENSHFTLAEFKTIFWWEWAHRLLGRFIGLAVLLPLIVFKLRGLLPAPFFARGFCIGLLIAFQGALGWFMVASGLVDEPRVSHYRLAAHLVTAFSALVFVVWTALDAGAGQVRPRWGTRRMRLLAVFFALLVVQITWGAFVAGLDAGLYYPTYPRMGGQWIPPDMWAQGPAPGAFVTSPVAVQWFHRWWGAALLVSGIAVFSQVGRAQGSRRWTRITGALLVVQFLLGVATVVHFHQRPVLLGLVHQAGAMALLVSATVLLHRVAEERDAD